MTSSETRPDYNVWIVTLRVGVLRVHASSAREHTRRPGRPTQRDYRLPSDTLNVIETFHNTSQEGHGGEKT